MTKSTGTAPIIGVVECGKLAVENTSKSPEMKRFDDALRRVLRVTKAELKELLAQDEASKVGKPKRGPKPKHVGNSVTE
jgi:hypothetical protein